MQTASPLNRPVPWYAQRWPWLLMLGPAIVVVAGTYTGYLAYTRQDAMVVDDYYKRGKAINQDLRRDHVASTLRLSFQARYDALNAVLHGKLESAGQPVSGAFQMHLAHPTLPERDLTLALLPDAGGRFSVALPMLERAGWHVVIESAQGNWRLTGVWRWPQQTRLLIDADPVPAR